ncbi:MAG: hypothetical protein OXI63_13830 [Candidatus Poribacteria bacterium]|nr:hypothetical protein [Candidatus Poribacteria bacterium]
MGEKIEIRMQGGFDEEDFKGFEDMIETQKTVDEQSQDSEDGVQPQIADPNDESNNT